MPDFINIQQWLTAVDNCPAAARRGALKTEQHHVHVCASGERYPAYIGEEGMIDPVLCTYMGTVRRITPSVHTKLQALRGGTALEQYTANCDIPLNDRIIDGTFLDICEQRGFDDFLSDTTKAMPGTRARRHRDGLRFMRFRWRRHAATLVDTPFVRLSYLTLAREFEDEFKTVIPYAEGSGIGRMGLSPEGCADLARFLTDPACASALWPDSFIALRNRLLLLCFVLLGHRVGEFLSLCLADLDLDRRLYRVLRHHNSVSDPRILQALTKGRERELRWPEALVTMTRTYIAERATRPLSFETDFLFVTQQGHPISYSLVAKIFDDLRKALPTLHEPLSPHILRHTWNDLFSAAVDQAGISNETEIRARMLAMGWKSRSMATVYTKRSDAQTVDRVSMGIQAALFAMSGSLQ